MKTRRLLAIALLFALLCASCFAEEADMGVTPAPTEAPAATEEPSPEETPSPTETPAPTEAPAATEEPSPEETPSPTETPAPTEAPSETEAPSATEAPLREVKPGGFAFEAGQETDLYITSVETDIPFARLEGLSEDAYLLEDAKITLYAAALSKLERGDYPIKVTFEDGSVAHTGVSVIVEDAGDSSLGDYPASIFVDGVEYDEEALKKDIAGEGWKWKYEEWKLTLSGYEGGDIVFGDIAIIELAEKTKSAIYGCLKSADAIRISGKGTLNIYNQLPVLVEKRPEEEITEPYKAAVIAKELTVSGRAHLFVESDTKGISVKKECNIEGKPSLTIHAATKAVSAKALYIDGKKRTKVKKTLVVKKGKYKKAKN